jgi:hypothetical protein
MSMLCDPQLTHFVGNDDDADEDVAAVVAVADGPTADVAAIPKCYKKSKPPC